MKKLVLLVTLLLSFLFTSCTVTTGTIKLPDLTGMSREEIKKEMEERNIEYVFRFEKTIIYNVSELDKFVSYGNGLKIGDYVDDYLKNGDKVIIYTTVLPLSKKYSPSFTLEEDWTGKSFINDGIGEVLLDYVVDGDTAWFTDIVSGQNIKVRFLGIDTPETKAGEDPWGLAASNYTKQRLENATTIVLEADGAIKDTYGRYLGFVWVDGILLNLEVIEEAYSNSTLSKSKYSEIFLKASIDSQITGRRFFGSEIDPNYDYEARRFK